MRAPTVVIAIPTHDNVPAHFAADLAGLIAQTAQALPDEVTLGVQMVKGTYVHQARQDLMIHMLENGATHILWLDSDMRFPPETLLHLLQHNLPVVGANYSRRAFGQGFTALKQVGGDECRTTDESEGLEEVEAIGLGCALVTAKALVNMPDPKEVPWFQHVHLGNNVWLGEDVHFCKLLREAGNRIFVDHDLSKAVSHIGQHEFTVHTA